MKTKNKGYSSFLKNKIGKFHKGAFGTKGKQADNDSEEGGRGRGKKGGRGGRKAPVARGSDAEDDDGNSDLGSDWDGNMDNDDYNVRVDYNSDADGGIVLEDADKVGNADDVDIDELFDYNLAETDQFDAYGETKKKTKADVPESGDKI